ILTDERLERYLHPDRLETIRQSIRNPKGPQSVIQYQAPWTDFKAMREESVDLILSQAVLEHIDDLEKAYQAMQAWLKPGGVMSHCIDFKCHNTADQWNGHWTYSDFIWNWMRGKRPYLLNREPLSTHLQLHRRCGFTQVELEKTQLPSHLKREDLMPQFQNFEADDLVTSTVFIQSRKERRSEN
ncbi:MAG: methyltransferase domain-containing protein, partial [Nitrospinaceae bacterium]|nr:methyltransferase domain-containing protein [Nitrospinaceae bacterium]NIR54581.1 methyltransferase domain-containing protein [Nitrospinaceae bacterium]NIS85003.1 methyltransferase domain-containing protein [Nitrospinaceae bacterium]NIT81814.1 methyltransferase domain-containing protein [Nitrospinaceae bacterium]NIU44077.1 methyltransferase domain-containing protein [Nitrospinaceae bacterium]